MAAEIFNEGPGAAGAFAVAPSPAEIAAEFGKMAQAGGDVVERAMKMPDFDSINPGRKRQPRELGNKIELKKPKRAGD